MAFDVYNLSEYQVELGYFALDNGKPFNEGKFLRLSKDDFVRKPGGNGLGILQEGLDTGMMRATKSGAYAVVAKQVQQIVSVYDRMESVVEEPVEQESPRIQPPQKHSQKEIDYSDDSIYSKFDKISEDEGDVAVHPPQPILTYLGAGLAIVSMIISSFISPTGLVGMFTVVLSLIGSIMTIVGTIQFFRQAHEGTSKNSKILHILLTIISFATFMMLAYTAFVVGPKVAPVDPAQDEQAITLREESESVDSSIDTTKQKEVEAAQLEGTIDLAYESFVKETASSGILNTGLPITITNSSDAAWTYDLTVQAYNVNGEKVGNPDFVLMLTVDPGETVNKEVFEYVTSEEADILSQEGMSFKVSHIVVS